MLKRLFRATLVGLLLAGIVLAAAAALQNVGPSIPSTTGSVAIGKNLLYALSARALLSSTLQFHTENERNYSAMLNLFISGHSRLKRELDRLSLSFSTCPAPAGATSAIAGIQQLLFALGRESLAEHAEWLQLHRDRPVTTNLPNP